MSVFKSMKICTVAILIAFLAEIVGCGVAGADFAVELAHDGESASGVLNHDKLPDPLKGGSSLACSHGCAGHASSHLQAATQQTNFIRFAKYSDPLPTASVLSYRSAVVEPTYRPPRSSLFS